LIEMETTFTESPAFEVKAPAPAKAALPADDAAGDGSTSRADLEAALALLNPQDGDDPQTVEAMEAALRSREAELEAKFEAKLAQLEAKLTEGDGPLSSVARSVVAHLSEAPPNWHQATVLFASTQEPNARLRVVSLAISMLIVACQCMVTVGVWVGTINKSCHTSDEGNVLHARMDRPVPSLRRDHSAAVADGSGDRRDAQLDTCGGLRGFQHQHDHGSLCGSDRAPWDGRLRQ
jgi:hypothetical protein